MCSSFHQFFRSFCLGAALFLCSGLVVHGQVSLGVIPPKTMIELMPGQQTEFTLQLINNNDTETTFRPLVRGSNRADEYGNPIMEPLKTDDKWQLGNWVTPLQPEVTVAPYSMAEVRFSIHVPADTPKSGYYGLIIFSPTSRLSEDGNVAVVGEIGTPILAKVGTDLVEKGEIVSFDLDGDALKDAEPIRFRLRVRNDGDVHLLPQGKVRIEANRLPLMNIGTMEDVQGAEVPVDYLDINPTQGYVLPHSTRTYIIPWKEHTQYSNLKVSYDAQLTSKGETLTGSSSFSISKEVVISSFLYDEKKREFQVTLHNKGNVQVPLQGQIALYGGADANAYETILYPTGDEKVQYLGAGKQETLYIPWKKPAHLDDPTTEEYGLFLYVLDNASGKTLTSKAIIPKSEKATNAHPLSGQLPYIIVIVLLVGIIGLLALRGASKE